MLSCVLLAPRSRRMRFFSRRLEMPEMIAGHMRGAGIERAVPGPSPRGRGLNKKNVNHALYTQSTSVLLIDLLTFTRVNHPPTSVSQWYNKGKDGSRPRLSHKRAPKPGSRQAQQRRDLPARPDSNGPSARIAPFDSRRRLCRPPPGRGGAGRRADPRGRARDGETALPSTALRLARVTGAVETLGIVLRRVLASCPTLTHPHGASTTKWERPW